jgi:hypothetical protein
MSYGRIKTKDDLKQWILSKLGQPLVDVILENNGCGCAGTGITGITGNKATQIDHAIDDAVERFQYFAGAEGNERRILIVPLQAGQGSYEVPCEVLSVKDSIDMGAGGGVNTLFTLDNSLFGNGNWPLQGGYGGGGEIVDYTLAMQWLRTFEDMTSIELVINHRQHESVIDVYPTPRQNALLPMEAYVTVPNDKLYGNIWVRDYALAMSLIQVGMNTGSVTGIQFPQGGEFNYQMYLDQGTQEKERLLEEMKNNTFAEPIDFFMS